jgi:FixJ family two-component response regulator
LDFQQTLRELGIRLPVIFITGHGDIPISVRAMKSGAIEFLTKPINEQQLLDAVHAAIELDRANRQDNALHRSHVMQKMQAKSLVDLVRMADKLGVSAPKPKT